MSASRRTLCVVILAGLALAACGTTPAVPSPTTSDGPSPPAQGSATPAASIPASPAASVTATPVGTKAAWLPAGDLREARSSTHVALLGTGEVLVVGSDNVCAPASGGSDSVEIGDARSGRWETTASLSKPREGPVVVPLRDGRALMTGGLTGEEDGPSAYSSSYTFDPSTRSWSRSGLMHTARAGSAAAVLADGRVLVAGGLYIDKQNQGSPRALDTSEIWDPTRNAWSQTGRLGRARIGASAVTLSDGRVLIVGGLPDARANVSLATAEIFDPSTEQWSAAGELESIHTGPLVALPDGGAIVAGGVVSREVVEAGESSFREELTATVERYRPTINRWDATGAMLVAAADRTVIGLPDGRVLAAGGVAEGDDRERRLIADAELLDPVSGIWQATTPMPRPRAGASAVVLGDGSALVVGGDMDLGPPDDVPSCPGPDAETWRFDPGS